MQQFADRPENAEAEKYSHEWWQVRDGLEGRHCDQEAQPQEENQIALEQMHAVATELSRSLGGVIAFPLSR